MNVQLLSLCSDMDEHKYVLTTLSAENDLSEVADVISIVKYNRRMLVPFSSY